MARSSGCVGREDVVGVPPEGGGEVEAEAVDLQVVRPVAEGVHDEARSRHPWRC